MTNPSRWLLAGLLAAGVAWPCAGAQAEEVLQPELRAAMDAAPPGEKIRAYLVMEDQVRLAQLEDEMGRMGPKARRQYVARRLQAHAAATQKGIRAYLQNSVLGSAATIHRDLWVGNALEFEAEPAVLEELALLPGIHRIRIVPDHPLEEVQDAAPAQPLPPSTTLAAVEQNIINLQAPQLWAIGQTGQGVVICNIDSGVNPQHPDLLGRLWVNAGETKDNGIDDDGNGFVDDLWGWDFENNDATPNTSGSSHGTNTAGLMVGDGTNGTTTGMAVGAKMAVCQINGETDYWAAQQYAILIGADVISSSHSWKWPFSPKPDYHLHRQICDMELAAAINHANSIGNQGNSLGSYPIPWNVSAPGNCPQPWGNPSSNDGGRSSVMGCAGIKLPNDALYTSSGQGPSAWEDVTLYDASYPHSQDPAYWDYPWLGGAGGLLKPDVSTYTDSVITTGNNGSYVSFSGTSAATPQLGGGLALLRGVQPNALPRHICAAIELTAEDLGPAGKDLRFGAGKLQVFDAARRLQVVGILSDQTPDIGDTVTLDIYGEPNGGTLIYYGGSIFVGPAWNLTPPFFYLGPKVLDGAGHASVNLTVPNNAAYSGLEAQFQIVSNNQNPGDWGGGAFFSVPELLAIN